MSDQNATYKVCLNEQQRAIIQRALVLYLAGYKASDELPADDHTEALSLHSMTKGLPADELEMQTKYGHAPGTTLHGFAL